MGHDTDELRHDDPPPQRCPDCTELVHAEEWEMHMADHDKQEIHDMTFSELIDELRRRIPAGVYWTMLPRFSHFTEHELFEWEIYREDRAQHFTAPTIAEVLAMACPEPASIESQMALVDAVVIPPAPEPVAVPMGEDQDTRTWCAACRAGNCDECSHDPTRRCMHPCILF